MRSLIVLAVIFCGCFSQGGAAYLFPRQTSTDHVILKTAARKPLKQLTASLDSWIDDKLSTKIDTLTRSLKGPQMNVILVQEQDNPIEKGGEGIPLTPPVVASAASTDRGQGATILFPRHTSTDHVILKTAPSKLIKQLTVCLQSYTELNRHHSLFSLATPVKDNALLIFPLPPNNISIAINNQDHYFKVDTQVVDWKSTCVTWDSTTGLLQLWINGKRYPRRVTTTRSPIDPQMSVILGQEQDSFGGQFDVKQSFVGEIRNVNMWDYVLPSETIKEYFHFSDNINGNIIAWKNKPYEEKLGIMILEN